MTSLPHAAQFKQAARPDGPIPMLRSLWVASRRWAPAR